jgi:hypothetical protein
MNRLFILLCLMTWIIDPVFGHSSEKFPYKDASLAIDGRVKDLLSRMTLEEKEVVFTITPNLLKLLNREMKWVVEPGEFRIMIGSSCKDIRLRDNLMVTAIK